MLVFLGSHFSIYGQVVRSYCIEVTCNSSTYNSTQSILQFSWPYRSPTATSQNVYRKNKEAYDWGNVYKSIGANDSTFSDTVLTGKAYEYMFEKINGPFSFSYPVYGYIYAGHKIEKVNQRGTILLLIDSTHKNFLANSFRTYRNDLIGDGWTTVVKYFSPSTTVYQIKSYIYNQYWSNPSSIKSVVLIGNLAVPYSGDFSINGIYPPDEHVNYYTPPSHEGAWSTDLYYGDMMRLNWPDSSVNNTLGARTANYNVPNDGKFDYTELPNILQLQVGRIDLSDLSNFKYDVPDTNNIERELLKRYFVKNHDFRQKKVSIAERCLYASTIPLVFGYEHFATAAYQNMASLIANNVTSNLSYRSTLNSNSYLWSFAFGSGNYNYSNAVGYTADLANTSQQLKSVFTGYLSSYCADFDNVNNLLRAPLAAKGNVLNAFWCGRPHWYFHHMGLGETIGYSAMRTQSNYDSSWSSYLGYAFPLYPTLSNYGYLIHSSLMGDPTVRMQPVATANNFKVVQDSCNFRFKLKWSASSDTAVHTYFIYRAKHIDSTFTNIGYTSGLSWIDNSPLNGTNVYMLRAQKLQVSGSGTYYNLSQGVFDTVSTTEFSVPQVDAGRDTTVCYNQTLKIGKHKANSIYTTYLWSPGAYTTDTVSILASNGQRILLAKDTNSGCIKRDTMVINTIALPQSEILNSFSNFCSDTVSWSSSNNNGNSYRYEWAFTGGSPNDSIGFGLTNPGQILYQTAGTYSTTLYVRDTITGCASRNTKNVSVICVSLPVEWTDLQCKRVGDAAEINFTIYNYETIKVLHIEGLNQAGDWNRIKSIKPYFNGVYSNRIPQVSQIEAVRIVSENYNGSLEILDNCFWDEQLLPFYIYPNPVNNTLNIDMQSISNGSFEIFNSIGQSIYKDSFNKHDLNKIIDCSLWTGGMYTIIINNGKKVYSQKFIK